MTDEKDIPDCTLLLDEFIQIADHIAPNDTLILKVSSGSASIELLVDGQSIFKQERTTVRVPDKKPTN